MSSSSVQPHPQYLPLYDASRRRGQAYLSKGQIGNEDILELSGKLAVPPSGVACGWGRRVAEYRTKYMMSNLDEAHKVQINDFVQA